MMKYQELKGDLFKMDRNKWALAHCISADVTPTKNMNKGIAKIFRTTYPEMASNIFKKLKVGSAIRYHVNGHTIYNLVTKEKVSQKAIDHYEKKYYSQLFQALESMRDQMIKNGEKFLAMPKIASGLDKGNWDKISDHIRNIFANTEITIYIKYL